MGESRDFCPWCDDPVPERPESLPRMPRERDDVFCDLCYFEDFDLVDAPDEVQVRACAQCGVTRRGNRWADVGARDHTGIAIEEVSNFLGVRLNAEKVRQSVEPEQVDENNIRIHCHFSDVVRGMPPEESIVVLVGITRETCQRCGRIAGGYFTSLVQVRADDRTPTTEEVETATEIAEPYIAEREDKGDRNAFITEVNRTPDGPNIKISTNQMGSGVAEQIRERFDDIIEEYPTLATEDNDDNEVYRATFVARLPRYTASDVIDPEDDDGSVLVWSNRSRLKGMRPTSGNLYGSESEEGKRPEAEDLGSIEDAVETTVVTVEDERAVQVFGPETYEAKTIPRSDYFDPDAPMVSVLKNPSGLHIFSEEVVDDDGE